MSFTDPMASLGSWISMAIIVGSMALFRLAAVQVSFSRQALWASAAMATGLIAAIFSEGFSLSVVFLLIVAFFIWDSWREERGGKALREAVLYGGLAYLLVLNALFSLNGWIAVATAIGLYLAIFGASNFMRRNYV